jgi:nucleotide-binding universal stress UspA family protein
LDEGWEGNGDQPGAAASAVAQKRREYTACRAQAQGYLDSIRRSLRNSDVRIETRLEDGDAATVIADVARTLDDPVVVITPYGRSASLTSGHAGPLGRVAGEVLKRSKAPVLLARS